MTAGGGNEQCKEVKRGSCGAGHLDTAPAARILSYEALFWGLDGTCRAARSGFVFGFGVLRRLDEAGSIGSGVSGSFAD
jgi:hypothetical protein